MSHVPNISLGTDVEIPQLGLGVWQIDQDTTERVVSEALALGYRHIDTAMIYRNEEAVGRAIAASGISRDELFITTKLFNDAHAYDDAIAAADASLARLGLDYVDLYLIHWPVPSTNQQVEAWRAMIDIKAAGKARAIGVSNFRDIDLSMIIEATGVTPAVNQIELHPTFQQPELRALHAKLGIVTEAWSPLGIGKDLSDPVVTEIAAAHGVTPAQAIIRWHLQLGNVLFPKTATPARLAENFDVFGFELSDADMGKMATVDTGVRQSSDPASM